MGIFTHRARLLCCKCLISLQGMIIDHMYPIHYVNDGQAGGAGLVRRGGASKRLYPPPENSTHFKA